MNDNKYNNIDFSTFQCEPIEMSEVEKQRIRNRFVDKKKTKNKVFRYVGTIAAVACLGLCISVTALGGIDETFAAVKHLFMGTGEFLGVEEQDDFACVVNETQTKGDYTLTLNTVIASDREMRFNVTTKVDGGKKAPLAWLHEVWINGKSPGEDFPSDGFGAHYGSPKDSEVNIPGQRVIYTGFSYDYKMPRNPKIKATFYVGDELFTYEFVLNNEEFQEATKTTMINKTMNLEGMEVKLERLVINPMEQLLYVDTDESLKDDKDNWQSKIGSVYYLVGTNNLGEKVKFFEWIDVYFPDLPLRCSLRDVEEEFFESSSEGITWYELQWYNDDTGEFVGEKFVIEVE